MPTNHAANIGAYLQTITLGMQSNEINKRDNSVDFEASKP